MKEPIFVAYHFKEMPMEDWQEELSAIMPEIKLVPADSPDAKKAEVLVGFNLPEGMLDSLGNLKGVVSLAQGVYHILGDGTFPQHLKLARLADPRTSNTMAGWVMLAILEHHRNRNAYREAQQRKEWVRLPQRQATSHTTVAVMGLGTLGSTVARTAAMMGFRTLGWSRTPKRIEGVQTLVGAKGFGTCIAEADYLSSILPLTGDTRDLYDKKVFSKMKKGAVFINSGRGLQVIEEDLLEALDSGHLDGAVLDVVRKEPPPDDSPLWDHPKVTLWPHVSAYPTIDSAAPLLVESIIAIIEDQEPPNSVNIARGY